MTFKFMFHLNVAIPPNIQKFNLSLPGKIQETPPGYFQVLEISRGLSYPKPLEISRTWKYPGPGNFQGS